MITLFFREFTFYYKYISEEVEIKLFSYLDYCKKFLVYFVNLFYQKQELQKAHLFICHCERNV
jgi:hypothetical protein